MSSYKYQQTVEKEVEVAPCPCCGHDHFRFFNCDRDDSMHGAEAMVHCENCGHEVKVDGNSIECDSGRKCQFVAIDRWNEQYKRYGKPRSTIPPDIEVIQKELETVKEENITLKTVIMLEDIKVIPPGPASGKQEMYIRFKKIMDEFVHRGRRNP